MTSAIPLPSTPAWIATPEAGLQINSVALSADGNCCVAGTSNEFGTGQFAVYCYDRSGAQRWSRPVGGSGSTQGIFWVDASADGQFAAAGGETGKDTGFLTAYRVADGMQLLNAVPGARVNQVALSANGGLLLAVFDDTVQLYAYAAGVYTLASQLSFAGNYCNSCALAPDGTTAALSCTIYNSNGENTGQVIALTIASGQLAVSGTWNCPVGVMRVAVTDSGNYWGASLHDGSCALFSRTQPAAPLWQYRPTVENLSVGYGFDITETATGRVVLACGANLHAASPTAPGGYLYVVDQVPGTLAPAPRFCWGSNLALSANPGVSLDREALYVTATDGAPVSETAADSSESTGHFYLFDGASGTALWSYATPVMNWPMAITPDGTHAFGGSDDGSVYFWQSAA